MSALLLLLIGPLAGLGYLAAMLFAYKAALWSKSRGRRRRKAGAA